MNIFQDEIVKLVHGAGGSAMDHIVNSLILSSFSMRRALNGVSLDALDDGASIITDGEEIVASIDGHIVDPIFFPGGDIGRLAISGAVNDVSAMGAEPVAILDSIIVEEGFSLSSLRSILESMDKTSVEAGVSIINGDFKVMPRGHLKGITISTCCLGLLHGRKPILDSGASPGDKIIVTGSIGDHGIALMSTREGIAFDTELKSDVAPIWSTVKAALNVGGIQAMKDPTRGGLASALNEIAQKSSVSIWIDEDKVLVKDEVRAASEMLGLDPYEVTCEGRMVICVSESNAQSVLEAVRKTRYGAEAEIIGEVKKEYPGTVLIRTVVGGTRILRKPIGEPIPRVC